MHSHCFKAAQLELDENLADTTTLPSVEQAGEDEYSGAESEVSGGVGSTGALDRTDEDFTREDARLTGFMGKNSDVTWLQRLAQENACDSEPQNAQSEDESRRNGEFHDSRIATGEMLMFCVKSIKAVATFKMQVTTSTTWPYQPTRPSILTSGRRLTLLKLCS